MQESCLQAGVYLQVKSVPWYTHFVIFLFYMDLNVDFYFYIRFLFSFDGANVLVSSSTRVNWRQVVKRLTNFWFRILYGRSKLANSAETLYCTYRACLNQPAAIRLTRAAYAQRTRSASASTSPRRIGFCVVWDCISLSSSLLREYLSRNSNFELHSDRLSLYWQHQIQPGSLSVVGSTSGVLS